VQVRYIIGPEGHVDPADRGLAYGDGLFETMALRGGQLQRLGFHLDRLRIGCDRLKLPLPETAALEAKLATVSAGIIRGHVKLILTRGTGPRGYLPPPAPVPTVILSAAASSGATRLELSLASLRQRLGENTELAGIKHLCRLEQVLGRLELESLDADEGMMLSTSGHVIGGTSRNLFAVFGQRVVTPELSRAGICGVMRRSVLEQCQTLGFPIAETTISPLELCRADEIFMTNALVGIQSVTRFDGTAITSQAIAAQLRVALGLNNDA
jgi:4-amino-4-deoxychorismate lyase